MHQTNDPNKDKSQAFADAHIPEVYYMAHLTRCYLPLWNLQRSQLTRFHPQSLRNQTWALHFPTLPRHPLRSLLWMTWLMNLPQNQDPSLCTDPLRSLLWMIPPHLPQINRQKTLPSHYACPQRCQLWMVPTSTRLSSFQRRQLPSLCTHALMACYEGLKCESTWEPIKNSTPKPLHMPTHMPAGYPSDLITLTQKHSEDSISCTFAHTQSKSL